MHEKKGGVVQEIVQTLSIPLQEVPPFFLLSLWLLRSAFLVRGRIFVGLLIKSFVILAVILVIVEAF